MDGLLEKKNKGGKRLEQPQKKSARQAVEERVQAYGEQRAAARERREQRAARAEVQEPQRRPERRPAPQSTEQPPRPPQPRKRIALPLFIWAAFFYLELLLIVGNVTRLTLSLLLFSALFAGAATMVVFLLTTISDNPKINFTVLTVLLGVKLVYFGIQYFCKVFFKNYMSIKSIASGTKGVVTEFMDVTTMLILRRFWMVLLLLVPVAVLVFLWRSRRIRMKKANGAMRILAVAAALLLFLVARLGVAVNETSRTRYSANYEFDTATISFGLHTATRLDLQYLIFGNPAADSFDYNEPGSKTDNSDNTAPTDNTDNTENGEDPPDNPEPPVVYGYNELDVDFAALSKSESRSDIASIHSYVASQTPSHQNAYTGLFQGKNLIFLTAEAFSKEAISEELTPTLYRMYKQGIYFTDYYQPAWGGSTSTGEFSNMTGLVPVWGVDSMLESSDKAMPFTLGNQLRSLGYFSRAYHANTYTYYSRHLTHENLGYEKYIGYGNGLEDKITKQWPQSDLELMQVTLDDYIDHQPFSVYYMTVSGHAIYTWNGNMMSYKNRDAVKDLDVSEPIQAYLACNLELEYAMSYLIQRLEEAGIADDTVIVLGTDHYPYGLETEDSDSYRTALDELYGYNISTPWEQDHSALLIWSGCLEDMDPIEVDTPVFSLDIVPTLSNLMGLKYDSRLLAGRDVFSDATPLVFWPNYSWKTDKASYNTRTGECIPVPGCEAEVTDEYISAIKSMVSNRFSLSRKVVENDYYRVLLNSD
ncbi:MAG: LTA synthase family protein [Oscillospiraceae bacterium]|nr:LTA synthase family protein [Oscillospiraceae bacterium]